VAPVTTVVFPESVVMSCPLEIGSRSRGHLVLESDGIEHRPGRSEEGPHIGSADDRARQHRGVEDDILGKGGGEGLQGWSLDDLQPTMPRRQIPLGLPR
jgi:hypothetical protein